MINGLKASAESGSVIITRSSNSLTYNVYVLERLPNGVPINTLYVKKGITYFQKYNEGNNNVIPFLSLNYGRSEELYSDLVDALLQLGIKPRNQIMSKEEKGAIENHLADMRRLVFKKDI